MNLVIGRERATMSMRSALLLHSIFVLFTFCFQGVEMNSAEDRLLTDLFSNYSTITRPVEDVQSTVPVSFFMAILQLIDIDEKMQVIKSNVWMYQEWDDYRLRWNPADYNNITLLVVPVSYIWNPDTSLLNSAEGDSEGYPRVHLAYLDVQIFSVCHIIKVTPGILRTPA
ncbi:neuronal acetylcholine receptor subunit alpha-2-like isoform X2 [Ptychodera flava]|uniref:neuronal acetylcholine receptor subunit alpha-2-like isoform X2 n=1 Tax=Ptychodera flava TaxID=63121 RepID=UPI00396A56DF